MGHGNVNAPFPENLRDPMHAEATAVRLQDLFLILRATLTGRFVLVLVVVLMVAPKLFIDLGPKPGLSFGA